MIKRTLYFGNPCRLSTALNQLVIAFPPEIQKNTERIPLEDIGLMVLDHPQIGLTHGLCNALIGQNAAVLWCNAKHLPHGLLLPLEGNQTYAEKLEAQVAATKPLKKQLWKQTIQAKLKNQAHVLNRLGYESQPLVRWAEQVQSGDASNKEARAAAYYWKKVLSPYGVTRGREEAPPNALFNYGYAILRALIARNLVSSGCHPTLGLFHHNKYNAFCLADDVMEPYRPFVDQWIMEHLAFLTPPLPNELSREDKVRLLKIPTLDVEIEGKKSPLMVAAQRTTASLMGCFEGVNRKILYPSFP